MTFSPRLSGYEQSPHSVPYTFLRVTASTGVPVASLDFVRRAWILAERAPHGKRKVWLCKRTSHRRFTVFPQQLYLPQTKLLRLNVSRKSVDFSEFSNGLRDILALKRNFFPAGCKRSSHPCACKIGAKLHIRLYYKEVIVSLRGIFRLGKYIDTLRVGADQQSVWFNQDLGRLDARTTRQIRAKTSEALPVLVEPH